MDLPNDSVWRMLAFNTPPFLMLAIFMFPDLPQARIPSRPRPLPDNAWEPIRVPGAGPAEDSTGESQAIQAEPSPADAEAQPPLPESMPARQSGWLGSKLRGTLPEPWGMVRSLWSLARRRS